MKTRTCKNCGHAWHRSYTCGSMMPLLGKRCECPGTSPSVGETSPVRMYVRITIPEIGNTELNVIDDRTVEFVTDDTTRLVHMLEDAAQRLRHHMEKKL